MPYSVYTKALQRAAEVLGGSEQLREVLHVPMRALEQWLAGTEQPPMDIFLKAVDVITAQLEKQPSIEAVQRSRQLQRDAAFIRGTAERTIERSKQIWASILAGRMSAALKPRAQPVAEFLAARFEPSEGQALVETALDAAMAATAAPMGNLQLAYPEGLRIVAHRGFKQPFLDFFASVTNDRSACGLAFSQGARVVVADVASDPLFAGKPAAAIMEEAHSRALQSTPLIGVRGQVLGMLSTHFDHPHVPSDAEFEALDLIAHRTAIWLGSGTVVPAAESNSIKDPR